MAEEQRETLVGRTWSNLATAWHDIAVGAARTVGLSAAPRLGHSERALKKLMRACLEARGGEVSARMRAAELGETYLEMDEAGRLRFLEILARDFAVDDATVRDFARDYLEADPESAQLDVGDNLRRALVPPRVKLLTQFNVLPAGVKFLADLRADLLRLANADPYLRGLERDLHELLESWFDVGFLDLRRITWDSPASLLEKLIAYEAVHEIRSWDDLRKRLDSDRRLYALFHPRMPDEPLAFVEVALVKGMTDNVQVLLDQEAPAADPRSIDTAIFYSISNTQEGLRGINFGDFLIKRVVQQLAADVPKLKLFATLSPVPRFRAWLEDCDWENLAGLINEDEQGGIRALGGSDETLESLRTVLRRPDWHKDPVTTAALKGPLLRLCLRYLLTTGDNGQPIDSVARFHLRNGARLERLNWLGDTSENGLAQSAGIMVNYRYILDDIEKNHEAFMQRGGIALSSEVRTLAKTVRNRWLAA